MRESLLIRAWHDGELTPGQDWQREIEGHLRGADIVLLLVSVDFLSSEFVRNHELPIALQRHQQGQALVIPVVLRPVPWDQSGPDFLQALPDKLRPVVLWSPHDLAYVNICEGLFSAVLVWQGRKRPPASPSARTSTVRRRVLDLALPLRVPVRKATIFVVMVRRMGEHGLRTILEMDSRYGVTPEEVESTKSFPLEFPRNDAGQLAPLDLTIAVESGDFLCHTPQKNLMVPPQGDSPICVFLLEAQHAGPLVLIVEISYRGRTILSQPLGSEGVASTPFEPAVDEFPCFDSHIAVEPPAPPVAREWNIKVGAAATPHFPQGSRLEQPAGAGTRGSEPHTPYEIPAPAPSPAPRPPPRESGFWTYACFRPNDCCPQSLREFSS
jgi:TIR domain